MLNLDKRHHDAIWVYVADVAPRRLTHEAHFVTTVIATVKMARSRALQPQNVITVVDRIHCCTHKHNDFYCKDVSSNDG